MSNPYWVWLVLMLGMIFSIQIFTRRTKVDLLKWKFRLSKASGNIHQLRSQRKEHPFASRLFGDMHRDRSAAHEKSCRASTKSNKKPLEMSAPIYRFCSFFFFIFGKRFRRAAWAYWGMFYINYVEFCSDCFVTKRTFDLLIRSSNKCWQSLVLRTSSELNEWLGATNIRLITPKAALHIYIFLNFHFLASLVSVRYIALKE